MQFRIKHTLIVLAVAAASALAYAAHGEANNDAQAISKAKLSLVQAVLLAEQHAHGQASRAEFEQARAGWVYDIEVVSGEKVFDVKVDPDKGAILSSVEDSGDHDDYHDRRD